MSHGRLGDRLLDLLVRRGDAGACRPNTGQACNYTTTSCGGHVLYEVHHAGTYDCGGICPVVDRRPIGKC
jgi:hypothetical protein